MGVSPRKIAPKPRSPAAPKTPLPDSASKLRLALSRGSLTFEFDKPLVVGGVSVALRVVLPDVRFPVDLTGGVARFRHRRGRVESLSLVFELSEVAKKLAVRLRGLLGTALPEVVASPGAHGVQVGVLDPGGAVLAFDLLAVPERGDVRVIVANARGAGLSQPAEAIAHRAVAAALKGWVTWSDGLWRAERVASRVARTVLPDFGARAPEATDLAMSIASSPTEGVVTLVADHEGAPAPIAHVALRALELAGLTDAGDRAAHDGDLEAARRAYVIALENAPRHADIARRLAACDLALGGGEEAALSILVESIEAIEAGEVGGRLLERTGDRAGAYAAFARAASTEPYGPLASAYWLSASRMTHEEAAMAHALTEALVRSPRNVGARWERFELALRRNDLRAARADAEHAESIALGVDAKRAIDAKSGEAFARAGYPADAHRFFERALRYGQSDAAATLGLARAMRDTGRTDRSIDAFARAADLSTSGDAVHAEASLELARLMAAVGRDLSLAVARLGSIPDVTQVSVDARLLEAEWRIELRDFTGAARSLERLRAHAERLLPARDGAGWLTPYLKAAATIEETRLSNPRAAVRCLELALSLGSTDRELSRRLAELTPTRGPIDVPSVTITRDLPSETQFEVPAAAEPFAARPFVAEPFAPQLFETEAPEESSPEERVEDLTQKLRANPRDRAVARELALVLDGLEHDMELVALTSARIDEDPTAAEELEPFRDRAFDRLAEKARREGRPEEASLYDSMKSRR